MNTKKDIEIDFDKYWESVLEILKKTYPNNRELKLMKGLAKNAFMKGMLSGVERQLQELKEIKN